MTTSGWQLEENHASEADILAHLQRCDARFMPPLSGRTNLFAYARRLHDRACRVEAWADSRLIGLVAVYLDREICTAFISNVSVEEDFLRYGIASTLLMQAIAHASVLGLTKISLQVGAASATARRLYEKHGFHACAKEGEQIFMQLDLPGTTP